MSCVSTPGETVELSGCWRRWCSPVGRVGALALVILLLVAGQSPGSPPGAARSRRRRRRGLRVGGLGAAAVRPAVPCGHRERARGRLLVGLAAVYIYLTFVRRRSPDPVVGAIALGHFLVETLTSLGLAVLGAIPNLFVVALIFVATRFVVVLARSIHRKPQRRAASFFGDSPRYRGPDRRIVTVLLGLFAVALAYTLLPGSSSEAFKGGVRLCRPAVHHRLGGLVGQAMTAWS